jgi:hypothetical protein
MSADTFSASLRAFLIVWSIVGSVVFCLGVVVVCLFGNSKVDREADLPSWELKTDLDAMHPSWSSAGARGRNVFITHLKPTPDTLHLPEGTIRIKECWLEHEVDVEVAVCGRYWSGKTGRVYCCITLAEGKSILEKYQNRCELALHPSDPPETFASCWSRDKAVFYVESANTFAAPIAVRVGPLQNPWTVIILSRTDEEQE